MSVFFHLDDSKLRKLQQGIESLERQKDIPITELMTDYFIRLHGGFDTFQALVSASGIKYPEELSGNKFSEFIAANTTFESWEGMQRAASDEYVKRKLGLLDR